MQRQLFIMLKEPHPGKVKTRLGSDLGMVPAAWWFRHQTKSLIRRLSRDQRWVTNLAVSPDIEGLTSKIWPQNIARWPQGTGSLGDRMGAIFRSAPAGPVVIVGADIPGIMPNHIEHAFRKLGSADTVFGPAPDGGYWLIGMKRRQKVSPNLFKCVRWSSPHALADTIATLSNAELSFVETLQDVDTLSDLR